MPQYLFMVMHAITVVELTSFQRRAEKILSADEHKAVIDFLAVTSLAGDEIQGTGGVRKVRFAMGKDTGAVSHVISMEMVDVRAIRTRLGLSRPKFAERFGLDARTVQDWEQGRRQPDKAAQSYLKVIAANPDVVAGALAM